MKAQMRLGFNERDPCCRCKSCREADATDAAADDQDIDDLG
jgi:hypothetical protein